MVDVTDTLPSLEVARKARLCLVKPFAIDRYLVVPPEPGKKNRLVVFTLRRTRLFAYCCNDLHPDEQCPANQFRSLCYHVQAALDYATEMAKQNAAIPQPRAA